MVLSLAGGLARRLDVIVTPLNVLLHCFICSAVGEHIAGSAPAGDVVIVWSLNVGMGIGKDQVMFVTTRMQHDV
jgi:hypothetical protein